MGPRAPSGLGAPRGARRPDSYGNNNNNNNNNNINNNI